ncbi:ADP-ribosylglycohydrolase family protein [Streptomyces sp. CNQ085]|uniref:ADP-ribosylglycohydrolase family protein n=1 Tax=Streptomyces sp. CNQ085 TaxID=2886944 RepID=UPI001F50BE6F|nr:ADP-ribosylglycohydrolase family protein [Streptomyces sp. CNQ085]MCI0383652.1 ADP-ribosylglycohydrolase family protein [Streptomyces sp. CNQ085]
MNVELHPWADRARGIMVGAAVGDAMGWPYERRDRTRSLPSLSQASGRFFPWQRLAGSRFRPLPEDIGPGEYSDDTQMLIAVARARLTAGNDWLSWLKRVEWPFLLDYERGAGASVKRACRAWEKQGTAWGKRADDQEKYFNTGANGAAMRIAPHVIAHHESSFGVLATDVVQDATTTHGHPRALLGALVHAYALWVSLRQPAPLAYGWLIEATLDGLKDWREPVWQSLDRSWLDAATQVFPGGYGRVWDETVQEVEELLGSARATVDDGALSAPSVFLKSHGLTWTRTRGSGTLCAVAAIYLAARSAARPERGIVIPARQDGADTDTLASMTGSLLGAGLGQDWLGSYGRTVQDGSLLAALAEKLLHPITKPLPPPSRDEADQARTNFRQALNTVERGDSILLPDRRQARAVAQDTVTSGTWNAERTQLVTEDGQNIFLIRNTRRTEMEPFTNNHSAPSRPHAHLQGAYMPVADIDRVTDALAAMGLTATRHGSNWVSYDNLVIRQLQRRELTPSLPEAQLRLAIDDTAAAWERIQTLRFEGALQRDGSAFWARIDPHLIVAVNNAEPPTP